MTRYIMYASFYYRPWWMLWLVQRVENIEFQPPPNTSLDDMIAFAKEIRDTGADVWIEEDSDDE